LEKNEKIKIVRSGCGFVYCQKIRGNARREGVGGEPGKRQR